tara:strand:- start:3456 stop:4235 length:780 start_codon:yes stop_codon:yes gene_type:complete
MATTTFTPSMLRGAGTRGIPEIPAGSSFPNLYSLDLDGVDDYAEATASNTIVRKDKTISFWIKADSALRNEMVMCIQGNDTGDYFALRKLNTGELRFGCRGASIHGMSPTSSLYDVNTIENWTHFLVTKGWTYSWGRGQIKRIFANGVEVTGNQTTCNGGANNKTVIGKIGSISYYGDEFQGEIDELSIFEGHLTSSANINAIYNGGVPSDLTDLNPLVWYRMGDIVAGSGSNVPNQGSNTEGDLVLFNDTSFSTDVPT